MKILITNVVASNTGDAAILLGLINILKQSFEGEIDFLIFEKSPELSSKAYPDLRFQRWLYLQVFDFYIPRQLKRFEAIAKKIRKFLLFVGIKLISWRLNIAAKLILGKDVFQSVMEYYNADLVVSTGGTYLVENYPLEPKIFDFEVTNLLKKPLFLFTQSLGPFSKNRNSDELKRELKKSSLILLRDERSKKHLLELDNRLTNHRVVSDAAFALAKIEKDITDDEILDELNVAISVRYWPYFKEVDPQVGSENYKNSIRELVSYLIRIRKAKITFLSTCQGIPGYKFDDSKFAHEVIKDLPGEILDRISVNGDFHSPIDLKKELESYTFVVSTRLHMAILSLGEKIPVLPIAYEFKTKELFDKLGFEGWALDIEHISGKDLIRLADKIIDDGLEIRSVLSAAVARERSSAFQSGQLVSENFKKLKSNSSSA